MLFRSVKSTTATRIHTAMRAKDLLSNFELQYPFRSAKALHFLTLKRSGEERRCTTGLLDAERTDALASRVEPAAVCFTF